METSTHEGPPMRARGLAQALAERAEAVCRHYLSGGRKEGRYWTAGDVAGAKGRSLYVRLAPPGAVGYWRDAATGEHGDLLELLRLQRGDAGTGPAMAEARRFLELATARTTAPAACERLGDRAEAARRLWRLCRPVEGTPAEGYLRARGIVVGREPALGFHPTLYYRDAAGAFSTFPALIARATRTDGAFAGLQRTYLDPAQPAKAPVPRCEEGDGAHLRRRGVARGGGGVDPRRRRGHRERALAPHRAARASRRRGALRRRARRLHPTGRRQARVLIARDNDPAGRDAAERLLARCRARGLAAAVLVPERGDLNDDLIAGGAQALGARLAAACADLVTTPPTVPPSPSPAAGPDASGRGGR